MRLKSNRVYMYMIYGLYNTINFNSIVIYTWYGFINAIDSFDNHK